ncbi:hypothetical protein ACUR5C_03465 [Aliikangiella sp. IMCC44653]
MQSSKKLNHLIFTKALVIRFTSIIVACCLLYIGALFVTNLSVFDQSLRDELNYLNEKPAMPQTKQNAYFAIMGINAAPQINMFTAGESLYQRYRNNRAQDNFDGLRDSDYTEILALDPNSSANTSNGLSQLVPCNLRKSTQCLAPLLNGDLTDAINSSLFQQQLVRMNQILMSQHYKEIIDATLTSPLPDFGTLLNLHKAQMAIYYQQQAWDKLLAHINLSNQYWNNMLTQSHMLISKMIAIAGLWSDSQVLSFLISKDKLTSQQLAQTSQLVANQSQQNANIAKAFLFEVNHLSNSLERISQSQFINELSLLPMGLITQKNATLNSFYESVMQPVLCLSKLSISQFYAEKTGQNSRCDQPSHKIEQLTNSISLYNLGGKKLIGQLVFSPDNYIARQHDLQNFRKLLQIQIEIKLQPSQTVESLLNSSNLKNLYTLKPFHYDALQRTLSFDCLEQGSFCEIAL